LEQKIRYWATKYGEVYVVTGGVLTDGLKTIGKEKVSVPNYFYKIVATKNNGKLKMIAFLVPHKESKQPLYTFVVPVDSIEKMTKVDFFPQLENKLENQLEKNKDYKDWSFN
jgi:endonuclease G